MIRPAKKRSLFARAAGAAVSFALLAAVAIIADEDAWGMTFLVISTIYTALSYIGDAMEEIS